MTEADLKLRTNQYALNVISFCNALPKDECTRILSRQLLRSGTSVGANYRAACRSKSALDFIAKLGIVIEEADECSYWLELLLESGKTTESVAQPLLAEANALLAILTASIKTARKNAQQSKT